ncbi:galectin-16-like [Eulemur rufifrons]|uniref:galectin-16-like n=1 Tax=Eulemur rufifrons TaxID=859984 RepID=UPI003742CB03
MGGVGRVAVGLCFAVVTATVSPCVAALSFSKDPQLQVDFHTGTTESSDIAFHIRVYSGHFVVMNSREDGGWRCEVRSSHMPFVDGRAPDLRILVLHNESSLYYSTSLRTLRFYSLPPLAQIWATQKRKWAISSTWQLRFVELKLMHSVKVVGALTLQ